jgi:hypothetical protein
MATLFAAHGDMMWCSHKTQGLSDLGHWLQLLMGAANKQLDSSTLAAPKILLQTSGEQL